MKIDRKSLISKYNPKLDQIDTSSPLTVGNGEFAFTADVTGLQSLYDTYAKDPQTGDTGTFQIPQPGEVCSGTMTEQRGCPLCTMSQWGWHTNPVSGTRFEYTMDDLKMTEYPYRGRTVRYPKDCAPGNEEVYHWLRQNPHRLNLGRIGLTYQGRAIEPEDLSRIHQELNLYEGKLESSYQLCGEPCAVEVCCDSESDTLGIRLHSPLLADGSLAVSLAFPYGSPDITASDWESVEAHTTNILKQTETEILLERVLDRDRYYVMVKSDIAMSGDTAEIRGHSLKLYAAGTDTLSLCVSFSKTPPAQVPDCDAVFCNAKKYWTDFWEEGGMIRLSSSTDERAKELQRRILLSMYLLAVNCSGSMPPQETGLTCNSWYGKMHLEMHFWHSAWAPVWNRPKLLERSMPWYLEHLKEAGENAARNGFKGARWPKMVAGTCVDSPSNIAPMLIWQQPHILFLLELLYQSRPDQEFLQKYWELVKQTAIFMADFAVYDEKDGKYDLLPPIIPVQECHKAEDSKNPAFELEYWRYGLSIAVQWADRLGEAPDQVWTDICSNMREASQKDGVYLAHDGCEDTFTRFNVDHPSMLGIYGVLPSGRIDKKVMENTLEEVLRVWNYETLWGWDFAVMAMTAVRLGRPELAVDCLLMDTAKNDYVTSGNNRQKTRNDLPLYLPGNGSLLLAVALMAAGGSRHGENRPGENTSGENAPGFPESWEVICEGINSYV